MEQLRLDSKQSNKYPDIITPIYEAKARSVRNYPQHVNRASECGHPCIKYLVLCRTRWEDKLLHGPELQFIFDGGNMIEDMAIREIQDAGFPVIEQQRPFEWKALELTGHVDAKVLIGDRPYPIEIKGLNHYDFDRLNTIDDFLSSKKVWIRKYPAQIAMYLLNSDSEVGLFYIKSKLNYQPKQVWVELDSDFLDYAESICKRLELVNKHVHEGTYPEGIDDYDVCRSCGFLHICLPEIKQSGMEMIDDEELEQKLERREELADSYKEYTAIDRDIKKSLHGRERLMVGDFVVTGKWVERKGYYVEGKSYWKSNISRLSPQEKINTEAD